MPGYWGAARPSIFYEILAPDLETTLSQEHPNPSLDGTKDEAGDLEQQKQWSTAHTDEPEPEGSFATEGSVANPGQPEATNGPPVVQPDTSEPKAAPMDTWAKEQVCQYRGH